MRDPIENIRCLQTQLNDLQLENKILKNILYNAEISYSKELLRLHSTKELYDYDPDQGLRLLFMAVSFPQQSIKIIFPWGNMNERDMSPMFF